MTDPDAEGAGADGPTGRRRAGADAVTWDAFVAASAQPSHLQASAWAAIKRRNGWTPLRVAADGPAGPVGGQLLVTRPRGVPWGMGYLPRGPVAHARRWTPGAATPSPARVREAAAAALGSGWVRMEPEVADDADAPGRLLAIGLGAGAPHVQPERHSHHRPRPRTKRRSWPGCTASAASRSPSRSGWGSGWSNAGGERLGEFYAIHTDAMRRAGIAARTEATYRDMWAELAPRGMARLLFAEDGATGHALATLFLVSCGPRVVDLYGGTTMEGGRLRANYLLKWEAIRRFRRPASAVRPVGPAARGDRPVQVRIRRRRGGLRRRLGPASPTASGTRAAAWASAAGSGYRRWRYRDVHRPDAPDDASAGD